MNGVYFSDADTHQSSYKLEILFLMEVPRYYQLFIFITFRMSKVIKIESW